MKQVLSNFVLFCGGANVRFLREHCPNERHKFYPIGLGVIITASLAFIAMMFATHSIFGANNFGEELVLFLFSLFWGFAIFTIDWGLIKTMRKKKENDELSAWEKFKSFIPVLFRLAVAIIISYSISRPLEVKIYEKRLKAQIEKDRQAFVDREFAKKNEKVKEKTEALAGLTKQGDEYLDKKNKSPQTETFKINLDAKKKCDNELAALRITNSKKIDDLNRDYNNLGSRAITPSAFKAKYDSLGNLISYTMLSWASTKRRDIKNAQIPNLQKEVSNKESECDVYAGKVSKEQEEYQTDYAEKIKSNTDQVSSSIANRDSLVEENSKAIAEITKASYVSFDTTHPGLITQLESMSTFEETPEGKSAGWVRLILLLVIICIDTAPIIIKLLTKRGVYEDMQEADEERLKFLTKQEGYSNNHLIQQLALAQKEILSEAVKRWKDKERNRSGMEDDYVNSTQQINENDNTS